MVLILVANPGSSSRKFALYDDALNELARLHVEMSDDHLVGTLHAAGKSRQIPLEFQELADAGAHIGEIFHREHLIEDDQQITDIGLRIVAPGEYFMHNRVINDEVIGKLHETEELAPLHISATLHELELLRQTYPDATVVGVSDSAFHRTKPNYAWNYAIDIHDADRFDIKRFGYHGISVQSAITSLWNAGKLPPKVVVCHLGSGSSVSAVFHGRSIDTTMGFTPNEGVVMSTRSGSMSPDAAKALRTRLGMEYAELDRYLNTKSGLLGIGGSSDIRELIEREKNGDHMAHLALTTLVHSIHKAVGSMIVAMNGCDLLVFTGTVGERSAILRRRIVAHLEFLDFILDGDVNDETTAPEVLTIISQKAKSRPIIVIPTDESREIAKIVAKHNDE